MPLLPHDEILRIHKAIISAQLVESRAELLSNVDFAFRAQMPHASSPSGQILADLGHMNMTGALLDGSVPLKIWLATAAHLASSHPEASTFQDALVRCGSTPTTPERRFEEISHDAWGASQTCAEKLIVGKTAQMPSREILFAPERIGQDLLPRGDIAGLIDACEIRNSRGHRMFPSMYDNGLPRPLIFQEGLVWLWDALNHGYYVHFAVGRDGSFMLRELIRESLPGCIRQPLAPGVGLFTCIDRVVGALLFARRLGTRYAHLKQAKLIMNLAGIEGRYLAFDFEGEGFYNIWLEAPSIATSNEAYASVRLFSKLDDSDIEAVAAKFAEDLMYFFGRRWNPKVVDSEIHNVLLSAINRDPLT